MLLIASVLHCFFAFKNNAARSRACRKCYWNNKAGLPSVCFYFLQVCFGSLQHIAHGEVWDFDGDPAVTDCVIIMPSTPPTAAIKHLIAKSDKDGNVECECIAVCMHGHALLLPASGNTVQILTVGLYRVHYWLWKWQTRGRVTKLEFIQLSWQTSCHINNNNNNSNSFPGASLPGPWIISISHRKFTVPLFLYFPILYLLYCIYCSSTFTDRCTKEELTLFFSKSMIEKENERGGETER